MPKTSQFTGERVAEGVGFEPTVGCPTLDFESSALNRTQPPFPFCKIDNRSNKKPVNYGK